MASIKKEAIVTDVITFHKETHGVSGDPIQRNSRASLGQTLASTESDINPEDYWQIVFEEIPTAIYVPCLYDFNEKITLISVKVANTKICSVFPNIDQASKEFEALRKPLTTRSIKFQSVIDRYNRVIQHDCAHEYGSDFELAVSDKFVLFHDFKNYYANVQKAFPSIWQNTETSIPPEDVSIVQGGMLELGHIPCPYISRGTVMLLPTKIVRIAAKGLEPTNESLMLESVPYLNGWPASPREIAFLTHVCSSNNIPLMFGRDTRLLPLSQVSCLFNDRMVIGNSIRNGKTFKKPANIDSWRTNGESYGAVSQGNQNIMPPTSVPNGGTQHLVNVPSTLPSTVNHYPDSVSHNRQIVFQDYNGVRFISSPFQVLNIRQPVPQPPPYCSTTPGGEKRRRVDNVRVGNVPSFRHPQSVGGAI